MGNFTRLHLLLITIAGLFLMPLQSKSAQTTFPAVACNVSSALVDHFSANHPIDFTLVKGALANISFSRETSSVKNTQVHYRKKFKRFSQVFPGIKPPVKDIEPVPFNIFGKNFYSKPHFLSHLHYFLFRLTPF